MAAVSHSAAAAALTVQQADVGHDRLEQLHILDHLQLTREGEEQSTAAAAAAAAAAACGLGLTRPQSGHMPKYSCTRG